MDTQKIINLIARDLTSLDEITAAGLTKKLDTNVKAGESDIDIIVYCTQIPEPYRRSQIYNKYIDDASIEDCELNVSEGGVWGTGDWFLINGVDTWLMYFTEQEIVEYLEAVLSGSLLDAVDGFYPTGRCATVQKMEILQDKTGFVDFLKQKVIVFPAVLKQIMIDHHLPLCIDEEDFQRAESKGDVLFYHQVLETALDHFLQVLFAVNSTFLPSRKRCLQYIQEFSIKPDQCEERLLAAIEKGASSEGVSQSCKIWRGLVSDLRSLME